VLSGAATDERWSFELRFPDEDAAARFYDGYDDPANPITIAYSSGFGLARQSARSALTPKQEATLVRALELGYFDVPRRAALDVLAAEFGVSDTAVSQRLRRGVANVLRTSPHLARPVGAATVDDD
jgi:predicted DNA binding protein